jgi:imidazolonepropionase-like amidohydrolase
MVVKTIEGPVEAVTLLPERMLAMTLSDIVARNFNSPGTRAKGMAMLRGELIKAQAYQKKKADPDPAKRPPVDLKMEALTQLLEGKYKALITANTVTDIQAALRLAGEFQFPLVLDGAAESYMLIDEIKNAGAEVIIHPTMARAAGEMKNMSMETAGILARAGIPVSLQTGFEGYVPRTRVLIYEAAIAAANGLAHEDALKAITSHPARLLGIDNRVGSIRPGLDADLALFDGNPFEYLAKVCVVIINGVVVDSLCE